MNYHWLTLVLSGRSTNINALRLSRRALIYSWSALQQHVLISDNSWVRKNYFLIIVKKYSSKLLWHCCELGYTVVIFSLFRYVPVWRYDRWRTRRKQYTRRRLEIPSTNISVDQTENQITCTSLFSYSWCYLSELGALTLTLNIWSKKFTFFFFSSPEPASL